MTELVEMFEVGRGGVYTVPAGTVLQSDVQRCDVSCFSCVLLALLGAIKNRINRINLLFHFLSFFLGRGGEGRCSLSLSLSLSLS